MTFRLADLAVVPEPGDNAAIVTRRLEPGTVVEIDGTPVTLPHTVLEGHRVVLRPIAAGEPLTSWSTSFARALRDLRPGDYVCTPTSLELLRARGVTNLPDQAAARNEALDPYELDETALRLGPQVGLVDRPETFLGFPREHGLAGTRNHIVLVATTSRNGAFVTELADRFDGSTVVPVAHTEAGEDRAPNNLTLLLRALAGFLVHPNVGAVLVVDSPEDIVTGARLRSFLAEQGYPPIRVPHAFFTRRADFQTDLGTAAETVAGWLEPVAAQRRTEVALSNLSIALQCGGSDAFSGISANPLAGAAGREVIRHGGTAVLAETDELIGAEGYVLENVRDVDTARRFLAAVRSFQERVGWHGHSAEGNPSGGNLYRGLYNIVLKSVGAARKRDRQLRLDHVVEYAEPLPGPGFVFMDSPGNDLESVAGQVASGCNLIYFTTGNGSITNFPFVPTLKFVTTTPRFELLRHEMDVDAGRYLTGTPMDQLTAEVFALSVATASGQPTAGERAGHSQVSIWRDWRQTGPRPGISVGADGRRLVDLPLIALPSEERDAPVGGTPLVVEPRPVPPDLPVELELLAADDRVAPEHLGLILPTSLCSGQIALRLAGQASAERWAGDVVTRYVALPHTEGCGSSGGASEETYARTMVGYLTHPNVRLALLLEHGCEKTHNDYFRSRLVTAGVDPARFGFASIQADGGIDAVTTRVRDWFTAASSPQFFARPQGYNAGVAQKTAPERAVAHLGDLTVGLDPRDTDPEPLLLLGSWIVSAGGTVLLSSRNPQALRRLIPPGGGKAISGDPEVSLGVEVGPTLAYGERAGVPGWQVMRMPGTDWLETVTGFGAGGAQVVVSTVAGGTLPGHRLVPVIQLSADPDTVRRLGPDLDGVLTGAAEDQALVALEVLRAVLSGQQATKAVAAGNVGFQITRGLLGTSM